MRTPGPQTGRTLFCVLVALLMFAAACAEDDDGPDESSDDTTTDTSIDTGLTPDEVVGQPLTAEEAAEVALDALGPIEVPEGLTTRGVDEADKVIRIGGVASLTDSSGVDQLTGACEGARARFERANREGGVNGYTIEYVGCDDDGQDPARNRASVRELVEQDEAFAIVPYSSAISDSGDYLNEQRVPYFGWGISPVDYCGWNDRQFAVAVTQALGCTTAMPDDQFFFSDVGIATYLAASERDPEGLKAAYIGSADALSTTAIESFETMGLDMGLDVVYAENPVPGAGAPPLTDYTPIAQAIIDSGAEFVAIPGTPGPTFGIIEALKAGGYEGDVLMFFFDTRLVSLAEQLDGVYTLIANFGYSGFGGEIYDQVAADLEAIDAESPADAIGTITSYGAADMFIQSLEATSGELTAEALSAAINGGWDYESPGTLLCPSTWPSSHVVSSNCAGMVRFDGAAQAVEVVAEPGSYGKVYLLGSS